MGSGALNILCCSWIRRLCVKILQGDGLIDHAEWRFLLTGGVVMGRTPPNPTPWLPDKAWLDLRARLGQNGRLWRATARH